MGMGQQLRLLGAPTGLTDRRMQTDYWRFPWDYREVGRTLRTP
jgi:hypothetical protein